MSNAKHIAELAGDRGIPSSSSVQQPTTEDIMKDICINKNWVEGGSMDAHDMSVPTINWNVYETDSVRVTETFKKGCGVDETPTYEIERVIARVTGEAYDKLMSIHWLMGGFGVSDPMTTRNAALFAWERARDEGIAPSQPYSPDSWEYREQSSKKLGRFNVTVHDDKDAKVLTVTGVIGG
jgi:hypothetical protein